MKRRQLVKGALWSLLGALCWPFISFVRHERFRPPVEVKVRKGLKPGERLLEQDFVLFMTRKGPRAVSRTCTHLGCRLNFIDEEGIFLCPCHQSRFSPEGRYISGPAKKDLELFRVRALEGEEGFVVEIPRRLA